MFVRSDQDWARSMTTPASRSISSATSESWSWHRRSDRRHTSETSSSKVDNPLRTRDPKTRNVLRRRPSGSAKNLKGRDRAITTPSRPNDPVPPLPPQDPISIPLTPAGALVEAYKQQELCRDHLPTPPNLSNHRKSSTPSLSADGRLPHSPLSSLHRDRWDHPSHHPSMSDPGGPSLSRKLSTRWQKITRDDSPKRHSKGRPSLHSLWESTIRPTGQSMDATRDASRTPSIQGTGTDKSEGGTKLWRLMRRISTGGLRDRFQSDKPVNVPPVPAIPKELLQKANQAHRPSSSSHDKSPSAPKPIPVAQPSVATSSSSPNSSDVASTRFFQKTPSARSSVSSYGEAVISSRTPDTVLHRHIITPREQLRLGDDHSSRRSISVPVGVGSDDPEADHVPRPFAHRQCSGDSFSPSSSRPPSASASIPGSAHGSFRSPGRLVDGFVSLSPPPRSSKASSRRGGSGSLASSPSQSMVIGVRQMDRMPSSQSDMTARLASPEPRSLHARDRDPSARTQLTFRELKAPRRPPLSEREKVDIWNDLLARSDEAGGTLHINGTAELMSDTMRLSMLSEWS